MDTAEEFLYALEPRERGRVISILRAAMGSTRDELARVARISPNTLSDWERGNIRYPRDLFPRLGSVLNLSLSSIQQALSIVRAQQRVDDFAKADAGSADETGYRAAFDEREMTPQEIEKEIGQLYSQLGRIETRIHLLRTELAIRRSKCQ